MRIHFGIIIILCLLVIGCTSNIDNSVNSDSNVLVEPFQMENVEYYKITLKNFHAEMESLEMEYGKKFLEAMNGSLENMELERGPDIVMYMDDNKEVEVRFGFYIRFIDGDKASNYYLLEPSEELIYAYTKIIEELELLLAPL